jgi:hydroxylamine reductase
LKGGVPRSFGLIDAAAAAEAADLAFVQISDSHIGFNKDANPDPNATLGAAIEKVRALPSRSRLFMLHTGDVSHLSKPEELDTAREIIGTAGLDVHYVPGEHDVLIDNGSDFFARFNGAVLVTTNCIVPPREAYRDRIFTTGPAGYPGVPHIGVARDGTKDFSPLIERARRSPPPEPLPSSGPELTTGCAHQAVGAIAGSVVDAVKSGAIRRFVVMAGCDGRQPEREYYTEFAQALPQDTVILTAGCAKYRYNALDLGTAGGIPRVVDAGQCNDCYSLVAIAQALADAFGVGVNDLPISYNIAWYEQKAVLVLLALLSLGVKNITLGPKLPGFVSPNVLKVLVENFNIAPSTTVDEDMARLVPA